MFKRMPQRIALLLAFLGCIASFAWAEEQYGPGVSDTEIKIGNTMPYSGPASAIGTIGHTMAAYFSMLNEQGGINGRKLNFISLDDGFSPPKTVEQVRKLVEQEDVALLLGTLGTAPNSAIHKYVNDKKVPQLFLISAAAKWNDPQHYPWSMSFTWGPNFRSEGRVHARHVLSANPNAKIAVLYQNDDARKDLLRAGLTSKATTAPRAPKAAGCWWARTARMR